MKRILRKHLRIFFACILIISLPIISSCSANRDKSNIIPSQSSSLQQSSESQNITLTPYKYETSNYCYSALLKSNVGDEVTKAAYDVIDAFIAHKTSVKVKFTGHYGKFTEELGFTLHCIYPQFSACVNYNSINAYNEKDGTVSWEYKFEKAECDKIIAECEKATKNYMSLLCEGDTDIARAILIYNALTKDAVYDYDALSLDTEKYYDEFEKRTATYNALVNKSGICYSYSFALAYLYIHAGINCITVSSQEGEGAHMWVMAELDGKYYYLDPTWDMGGGLYCFGMTSGDRASWAGSYAEDTCFAHSVAISGKYVIDDERFFDMRNYLTRDDCYTVEMDRKNQEAVISNGKVVYRLDCRSKG